MEHSNPIQHLSLIAQSLEEQGYIYRQHHRTRRIELAREAGLTNGLGSFSIEQLSIEAARRGLVLGHIHRDADNRRTFKPI